jgi:hypothetical protein
MADFNNVLMIIGIAIVFGIVIAVILWDQIRNARKQSRNLDKSAHGSPSSFDAESKTEMMTRIDKRESQMRRERILEGGTLPELVELAVYTPTVNEKISTPEVDVRGKTAIKSIVWINNQAAFVDVDGSFIGTIKLHKGKNTLEIVSIGPYGKAMRTKLAINCTAKEAVAPQSTDDYLLPQPGIDIHATDESDESYVVVKRAIIDDEPFDEIPAQPGNQIIVPESEIDPTVLAALRGDPLSEEPVIPDDLIPDIPDISGPEEETQLPDIPDVKPEEDEESKPIPEESDEGIEEAVKDIEELVKLDEEQSSEGFEPDKIMPIHADKDALELDEFQPLHPQEEGSQEIIVETKEQALNDERSTVIIHHNGLVKREDGETVPILKIEKRVENVEGKWFTTIGLANVSDMELKDIHFSEFISNSFKIKDKLPANVEEPVLETLPEGNKISWVIHSVKPQMKVFITYTEEVNPIEITNEEQRIAEIIVRK